MTNSVYDANFKHLNWDYPEIPLDLSGFWKKPDGKRNYCIVIQGRCGSTWLAAEIEKLESLGKPREWFNTPGMNVYVKKTGATSLEDYIKQLSKHAPIFGMQIDPMRLAALGGFVDIQKSFIDAGFVWIDMKRKNILAQAFSFARARATGHWHGAGQPDVDLEDDAIWREIKSIIANEQRIEAWYRDHKIEPLRILYEDLVDDFDKTVQKVARRIAPNRTPSTALQAKKSDLRVNLDSDDEAVTEFYQRNCAALDEAMKKRPALKAFRVV